MMMKMYIYLPGENR